MCDGGGCSFSSYFVFVDGSVPGPTIIPIEEVCRDFFGHLTVEKRYVVTSHCRSFGLS
jgi:hypothetical protein